MVPRATEQEWCELEGSLHSSGAGQLPAHPCCVIVPCTDHVFLCLKQVMFRKPLLSPLRLVVLHFDPFLKPWNCQENCVY